jgi:transcriptional regulator with XRE-family HTH domain
MAARPVSIHDIARAAGVSHATVSRALRNSPLISAEVRGNIQRLAAEMGYTPNAVAQSLKGQRSNTIGLVVTSIADPFYGRLARGVDEVAKRAGLDVFLGVSYNDEAAELAVIRSFQRRRVDGIITASSRLTDPSLDQLGLLGVPVVLVNQHADVTRTHSTACRWTTSPARGWPSVTCSTWAIRPSPIWARPIARAPTGSASRAIVPRWQRRASRCRTAGCRRPRRSAGAMPTMWPTGRASCWPRCAGASPQPSASTICMRSARCWPAASWAIGVPGQVSVVGFDDIELAQYVTPPLTTIHQPKLRLGQLGMEMLLDLMEGRPVTDQIVPVELVVRCSTGRVPAITVGLHPVHHRRGRPVCLPRVRGPICDPGADTQVGPYVGYGRGRPACLPGARGPICGPGADTQVGPYVGYGRGRPACLPGADTSVGPYIRHGERIEHATIHRR